MKKKVSRLGFLMDKFKVTGSEMAGYLNVHVSLVSKWRTNKRDLSRNSPHLKKIVEYFMILDNSAKYANLKGILRASFPDIELHSENTISMLLARWLSESNNYNSEFIINGKDGKKVYRAQFDVYKSSKGRKEAILRLFDIALSLPAGQELLMINQADISWMVEDEMFLAVWKEKLKEVLEKGTHIKIIHSVNRGQKQIFLSLKDWLPLHIKGYTTPYYYMNYTNQNIKMHMTIVKDKAVIMSTIVEGLSKDFYTYFYTDPISVQQQQLVFESFLSESRPLFEKIEFDHQVEMFDRVLRIENKLENSFFYNQIPFFIVIPEIHFKKAISECSDNQSIHVLMSLYQDLREQFNANVKQKRYRFIIDFDNLKRAAFVKQAKKMAARLLRIDISEMFISNLIQEIIKLMKENPNFEIALVDKPPVDKFKDMNFWIKENVTTLVNNNEDEMMFIINEPTITNAFYQNYDRYWYSIPGAYRDKNWVIRKLREIEASLVSKYCQTGGFDNCLNLQGMSGSF